MTPSSDFCAVLLAAALLIISLFRYLSGPLHQPNLENLKVILGCCCESTVLTAQLWALAA